MNNIKLTALVNFIEYNLESLKYYWANTEVTLQQCIDEFVKLHNDNLILQDKLHRRNVEIADLKHRIKILGEGLNAIRDEFYNTKNNPQVFIGNVEVILNATAYKSIQNKPLTP